YAIYSFPVGCIRWWNGECRALLARSVRFAPIGRADQRRETEWQAGDAILPSLQANRHLHGQMVVRYRAHHRYVGVEYRDRSDHLAKLADRSVCDAQLLYHSISL